MDDFYIDDLGLALRSGSGGAPTYDRYIDVNTGNDSNDGSSEAPWASFTPLVTAINALPDSGDLSALVRAGTYTNTSGINSITIGSNVNVGCLIQVYLEAGVVIQGVDGVDASFLDVGGSVQYEFRLIGLGPMKGPSQPLITGFNAGTGNGLGMSSAGGATMFASNIKVDNCVDGVSLHGTNSIGVVAYCVFQNCTKAAFAHVHDGGSFTSRHCDYIGRSGAVIGIGADSITGTVAANSLYEYDTFVPATAGQTLSFNGATVRNSQIGTLTVRVGPTSLWSKQNGTAGIVWDSFINAVWDSTTAVQMLRCYGKASMRARNGSVATLIDQGVFVDGASGSTDGFLYENSDFGSQSKIEIKNTILTGYAVALGNGFNATHAGYFSASDSRAIYNCLYGNTTNIDPDLAALGTPYIANNITSDPLLGPANSYVQNDYKVSSGSPTLGAGEGGVNIGLGLAS